MPPYRPYCSIFNPSRQDCAVGCMTHRPHHRLLIRYPSVSSESILRSCDPKVQSFPVIQPSRKAASRPLYQNLSRDPPPDGVAIELSRLSNTLDFAIDHLKYLMSSAMLMTSS